MSVVPMGELKSEDMRVGGLGSGKATGCASVEVGACLTGLQPPRESLKTCATGQRKRQTLYDSRLGSTQGNVLTMAIDRRALVNVYFLSATRTRRRRESARPAVSVMVQCGLWTELY